MTIFREFWTRSAHFGQNGGWDDSHGACFFCAVIQRTFQQLCNSRFSPNLVTKCRSVSRRGIWKDIFKTFHFRGHLPPKSEIKNRSNRHFTQSRLQVMGCTSERYCLLHVQCSPRARELPRSVDFSVLYDVQLWSYWVSKFPNFRILANFPFTKPLKRTFW